MNEMKSKALEMDDKNKQIENLLKLVLSNQLEIFNLQMRLNKLERELDQDNVLDPS